MPPLPRSTALRLLALGAMAVLAALLSNVLATPSRRLVWSGSAAAPPRVVQPAREPAAPQPATPALGGTPAREPATPGLAPLAVSESTGGTARAVVRGAQAPALVVPEPTAPIREVSSLEAHAAFQAGWPFLDARRSGEFAEGHVRGAFCVPVWEADLEDRLIAFKAARRPGPDDPIVIYCSGGDCRDSHLLAEKLLAQGYCHLLIYRDGYPDWVAQGHPTAKGAQP